MNVFQQTIRLKTHGDCHVIDITPDVARIVGREAGDRERVGRRFYAGNHYH